MTYVPTLSDHPRVRKEEELLGSLQAKLTAAESRLSELYSSRANSDPLADAKTSFLRGDDPGFIPVGETGDKAQAHMRVVVLIRAVAEQKDAVHLAKIAARTEIVEAVALREAHQHLLQAAFDAAKPHGKAQADLDSFYSRLEDAGIGGSMLGHFGRPLHPGVVTDLNTGATILDAWRREVEAAGYKLEG
jgi:hypothetical protein